MHFRAVRSIGAAAGLALVLAASAARAQTGGAYDLSWHTLGGGGVVGSTGGAYVLSGLAGQPAATLTAGDYTLNAGFWGQGPPSLAGVPQKPSLPRRFALYAPAPNPTTRSATITFDLPSESPVSLLVYDVNGRVVRRVLEGTRAAGQYHAGWDGHTEAGEVAAPGVYLVNFRAGAFQATRRIVHL